MPCACGPGERETPKFHRVCSFYNATRGTLELQSLQVIVLKLAETPVPRIIERQSPIYGLRAAKPSCRVAEL